MLPDSEDAASSAATWVAGSVSKDALLLADEYRLLHGCEGGLLRELPGAYIVVPGDAVVVLAGLV